jgi:hypothetical protein
MAEHASSGAKPAQMGGKRKSRRNNKSRKQQQSRRNQQRQSQRQSRRNRNRQSRRQ